MLDLQPQKIMAKDKYDSYTREQAIEELRKLEKRKKYGLVWEEEKTMEKFESDAVGKLPVLVEDKTKEIKTDDDKPTHILIEGDNFHALSVLNYTHAKSIDVIYIDPPYNTGSKDWKYNNDFVAEKDTFRHSKWLSFMSNRLKLAKKLLKPKGVLICTIDENEHATLGLLLQELFFDREIVCVTIIEIY
jgi:adenine-specific DNA-methyltransferase